MMSSGKSEDLGGSQGPVGEFQGEEGEKVTPDPCPTVFQTRILITSVQPDSAALPWDVMANTAGCVSLRSGVIA